MMTNKDFEWVADSIAPLVFSPLTIEMIADDLQQRNPRFNRDKFIQRAVAAWEKKHAIEDDGIPY